MGFRNIADPDAAQGKATAQPDNSTKYRRLLKWVKSISVGATVLMAGVIAVLALTPPSAAISGGINDKVLHFAAFAALLLPCATFLARHLGWAVAGALVLGAGIEILQPGVGRDASRADFLADCCGVGAGVVVGLILRSLIKRYMLVHKRQGSF